MEYKMRDVVRITGLPRTTIQGYYDEKTKKSLCKDGGGGPQWTFNDEELEDLWLIKICLGLGKKKNEIEILRKLSVEEKRKQLKAMLDTLQDYVRMANVYVEARPVIIQSLNKEDSSLQAVKILSNILTEVIETIEEDASIFNYQLSDNEWNQFIDLFDEISKQWDKMNSFDKILLEKISKIDKIFGKMVKDPSLRKYILDMMISEDENLSRSGKSFFAKALIHFYNGIEDLDLIFDKLMNPIYENCNKVGYTSSLIQKCVNDIYLFYRKCGLNKKYIDRVMKLLRDFYGSKDNIDKYESGLEKGLMWYFSKAIETFINNNAEREER